MWHYKLVQNKLGNISLLRQVWHTDVATAVSCPGKRGALSTWFTPGRRSVVFSVHCSNCKTGLTLMMKSGGATTSLLFTSSTPLS